MTMGKSFDTHGPLGPWIVTQNELGDPHDLSIRTYVNDELRQDGNTGEMIYDCYQQVAHLSEAFTLEPGDVIATGTPAGIGAVRQPFPEGLLKVGDVVRIEIEGIGELQQHGGRGARGLPRPGGRGGVGMGALTDELRDFLDAHPVGVLATASPEGRPRQSLVYFARDGERLLISTLADRLKARDVRRSGWASFCVMGHEPPYPSATFSGPAEILTESIGVPTASDHAANHPRRRAAGTDERRSARRGRPGDPGDHGRASHLRELPRGCHDRPREKRSGRLTEPPLAAACGEAMRETCTPPDAWVSAHEVANPPAHSMIRSGRGLHPTPKM